MTISETSSQDAARTDVSVSTQQIRAALEGALADLGIEAGAVTDDATFQQDLELDSTEKVQIALELTRKFGVRIRLEMSHDPTLAQVIDFIIDQIRNAGLDHRKAQ